MTANIEAAQRLQYHIENDLLTRKEWIGEKDDGRETACLLAAMVPRCGYEESSFYCPAEVMPEWLAHMTPNIDDGGSKSAWPNMVRRYAAAAARWHVLDDDAWRRVLLATLRECLMIAQIHDTAHVVAPVLTLIDEGAPARDSRWAEAKAGAATAGAATAWAAAAAGTAWAAAWAAAEATAATAATAWAAARAAAEAEAAWDRITDALLTAIEREC